MRPVDVHTANRLELLSEINCLLFRSAFVGARRGNECELKCSGAHEASVPDADARRNERCDRPWRKRRRCSAHDAEFGTGCCTGTVNAPEARALGSEPYAL